MAKTFLSDPRDYQIATLSALLIFGWSQSVFDISPAQFLVTLVAAFATQAICGVLIASRIELRSAMITTLSLSLLLRADALWPLALAAIIAIGSKFIFRFNNKHIFNPANIAIIAIVTFTSAAWVSPGQWGSAVWFVALLAGAGMFVTYRAARFDVPLIFLATFALLIFARAIWLGDPLAIPLLRLQNGALLLFAFFMISDPKTTPDGSIARAGFAVTAALISYVLIYNFYMADGVFYALGAVCLIRPIFEKFDPAPAYRWDDRVSPILKLHNGPHNA